MRAALVGWTISGLTRTEAENPLGQVVDPEALDRSTGPRGRVKIEVPPGVMASGGEVLVPIAARVACARCDGGGCDGCGRSGALRAPEDAEARVVRITLPEGGGAGVLRLVHPFGDDAAIEQLWVEITEAAEPTAGLVLLPPAPLASATRRRSTPLHAAIATVVIALVLAVVAAMIRR